MTTPNESTTPPAATEEENPPASTGEQETPAPEKTPEEIAAEQAAAATLAALPEWAQKEIRDTRAEAANYRTKFREAEARLATAKTPEEFEAAVNTMREENAALEKSLMLTRVTAKYPLPPTLVERLKGDTYEDLEKDAQALLASLKIDPESLRGGLNPDNGTEPEETDPRKLRQQGRRRR